MTNGRANPASPWPSPHELLLLRAALREGSAALDAWRRFGAVHPGIEHLDYNAYRLLPQLFRNLRTLDPEEPALGRLKGVYRHAWYANQQHLRDGAEAVALLQAAGIDVMLLKGAALIALYHRDAGVRPMEDVDVLVRPHEAEHAVEVLSAIGWAPIERRPVSELMRFRHAVDLGRGDRGALDLHWSALFPRSWDAELWDDATPVSLRGVQTLAPSPTDQLLLACAHGLGWSPAPLRWIGDAMLVLRSAGDQIEWRGLVMRARARGVRLDVADALEFLDAEFSLALPPGLVMELRRPRAGAGERVLHRVKVAPQRRGALWRVTRRTALRCDSARRLAAAPTISAGHPVGALEYLREERGLPTRRAALLHAARTWIRFLREAGAP